MAVNQRLLMEFYADSQSGTVAAARHTSEKYNRNRVTEKTRRAFSWGNDNLFNWQATKINCVRSPTNQQMAMLCRASQLEPVCWNKYYLFVQTARSFVMIEPLLWDSNLASLHFSFIISLRYRIELECNVQYWCTVYARCTFAIHRSCHWLLMICLWNLMLFVCFRYVFYFIYYFFSILSF